MPLLTLEGDMRGMTFQAAPVSKALASVKRMCASGHRVVFEEGASYIQNLNIGEVTWLREENGNHMVDAWVVPPQAMAKDDLAGFGRQT